MTTARIPLLNDHHTHISFYAALNAAADLSACTTLKAALAVLKERKAALTVAKGWKDNLYAIPRAELDKLGPVAVCNISLHSFRLNGAARKLLAARYPEIAAGIDDQPWVERNLTRIFELLADTGGTGTIPGYMEQLASTGIWAAEDMMVCSDEAALFLDREYPGRSVLWAEPERFGKLGAAAKAAVRGLKIFTDGALGARSAALSRSYTGGGNGLLLHSDEELLALVCGAAHLARGLAVHAIGDAALEQVVSVLERAAARGKAPAARIEHAQFITLKQALRAKDLGVALCMQPNFSSDSTAYADRLGAGYAENNNPFRMLIGQVGFVPGRDLLFGSDGMPHGAQAALEGALFPPFAGQRLTLKEFTAGYCLPDLADGWIDVAIDEAKKKVAVKVELTGAAAGRPAKRRR